MSDVDVVKGSELKIGMVVRRLIDGTPGQEMIVFEDGPYFNNALYADEDFAVIRREPTAQEGRG